MTQLKTKTAKRILELRKLDTENKSVIGRFAIGGLIYLKNELKEVIDTREDKIVVYRLNKLIQEIEQVEKDG